MEFHQPIAARVLKAAQERGALPYPVGAESKYEIPPLFYRLSGTFREANPELSNYAIRINPNRSGEDTVLRILRESVSACGERKSKMKKPGNSRFLYLRNRVYY